ncbi:glycosyltransferase [Cellulomonas sp. DKR-3]|uniref:Glycosyltransferase n=1 Tax=Cellulomonas fulva TaxID=2835530 RepID=A0ABS5TZN2_9CELL|nr:glycosyltransferase family 4 protein [Cellulomonas fulva]MBT0994619.1 glycosyltransferase [Cellulomonas fulva]
MALTQQAQLTVRRVLARVPAGLGPTRLQDAVDRVHTGRVRAQLRAGRVPDVSGLGPRLALVRQLAAADRRDEALAALDVLLAEPAPALRSQRERVAEVLAELGDLERTRAYAGRQRPSRRAELDRTALMLAAVAEWPQDPAEQQAMLAGLREGSDAPLVLTRVLVAVERPDLLGIELAALADRSDLQWPSARTLAHTASVQMTEGNLAAAEGLARLAARAGATGEKIARVRVEAADRLAYLAEPWQAPARATTSVESRPDALLAVLSQSLPIRSGGYATRSHGILTGLAAQGWHVEALTRLGFPYDRWSASDDRSVPTVDVVDGIPYHRALDARRRYPQHPLAVYTEQQAGHVTQAIERHRPALVQASSFYSAGAGAAVAARRAGLPFVYEMRGLGDLMVTANRPQVKGTQGWRFLAEMETQVCLAADGVLTLTGALRDEMIRRGVPAERIGVLPNGVHADQFAPLERDEELASELGVQGKVVLGYAGSLVEYEGLDLLLGALTRMRHRADVALVVVGDGPAENALRALSSSLGLDDQVRFVGRVAHTQVPRYLSLTDIAPFPRLPLDVCRLISPMKPFESMAMGRAVVSSDVEALAEIVDDGRTGRTFAAGDAGALADVLDELVDDAAQRDRLGAAAREWVRQDRDWSVLAAGADRFYRSVLSGGPVAG